MDTRPDEAPDPPPAYGMSHDEAACYRAGWRDGQRGYRWSSPGTRPDEGPDREALRIAVVARVLYDRHSGHSDECCRPDLRSSVADARAILAALLPAPPAPAVPVTAPDDTLRRRIEALIAQYGPGESEDVTDEGEHFVTIRELTAALAADRTPPAGDEGGAE